jgi:hypothetical protein
MTDNTDTPIKYGFFSQTAYNRGAPINIYETIDGKHVAVTGVGAFSYKFADKICMGQVVKWVRNVKRGNY